MASKREVNAFNISFLDLLSGALGAVIILFVAVPKAKQEKKLPKPPSQERELLAKNQSLKAKIKSLEIKLANIDKKTPPELVVEPPKEIVKAEVVQEVKEGILDVDVGFKFKGKKIVFLVDVSGSMKTLDKMGQVKAGLKMLITSMPREFEIDVIQFPGKNKANYYSLWSYTQKLGENQKKEVYRFLNQLRPNGATPTRSVLNYAMTRYSDVTDIVLLSDGAPTSSNSSKYEDIDDILQEVRKNNYKKIQINTIGVGAAFSMNSSTKASIFLRELAKESGGFFYGF